MIGESDRIKGDILDAIDELCELLNNDLADIVRTRTYVAGGAIVSLVLGQVPNDYDVFISDERSAEVLRTGIKHTAITTNSKLAPWIKAITANGITIKLPSDKVIQIVTRFYGPPSRVFETFDFTHCRCYYKYSNEDLSYDRNLILSKKLIYDGVDKFPVNSIKRMIRFVRRGYDIDNESILTLVENIATLDWDNEKQRGQQLIGFYGTSMK